MITPSILATVSAIILGIVATAIFLKIKPRPVPIPWLDNQPGVIRERVWLYFGTMVVAIVLGIVSFVLIPEGPGEFLWKGFAGIAVGWLISSILK